MHKSWQAVIAVSAGLVLAGSLWASPPPTTTFLLNGVGSGSVLAGVYTSPYSGTVSPSSPTVPVICDDFVDDSYVPEQWTAYVTAMSSLTPGGSDSYLRWLNTPGATTTVNGAVLDQTQAYNVAAVLALDIMGSSGQAQQDYSFALWNLFDPPSAFNQLTAYGLSQDEANAQTYLNNAVALVTNAANASEVQADVKSVTIYSYDGAAGPPTCNGGSCPTAPPQEFLVVNMPEPSFAAVFGLDMLAVGGLILFVRRRFAGSAS